MEHVRVAKGSFNETRPVNTVLQQFKNTYLPLVNSEETCKC